MIGAEEIERQNDKTSSSTNLWLPILALWVVMLAVGVTLAIALGIWTLWQAF